MNNTNTTELPYVICTGNAFDGLVLWGPFATFDEAQEYADEYVFGDEYMIVAIYEANKE